MNRSTLLHIRPNTVADRAVIEQIMKAYPTVFGFALQYEGQLIHEHFNKNTMPTLDEVMKTITESKEGHRMLMFGDWPKFKNEDDYECDIPPYIVNNTEDAPIMAMMYEGNFSKYSNLNGDHVDEYCVADELLFPRIEKAYEAAGGDFDKFYAEIKGNGVKTVFMDAFKDRGWYAFLPFTGDPYFFGANTQAIGFPWGSVSSNHGIDMEAIKTFVSGYQPPKAADPPAKKSGISFLGRKPKAETPEPEVKPVKDPAPHTPEIKEPEPVAIPNKTDAAVPFTRVKVPPQLQGGVRNAWIRLFNGDRSQGLVDGEGDLPSDHQSKDCTIDVHASLLPFTKENVNDTKSMRMLKEKVTNKRPATVVPFSKVGEDKPKTEPVYFTEMTDDEMTKAMEKMLKFLDAAAKKRPNPFELQKEASKRKTFSEQHGFDRNELLLRSDAEYLDLFDGNRTAVAVVRELKNWVIQSSGVDLEKVAGAVKEEQTTKVEQQEVTPTESQPAPAKKKSGIGFLKR